MYKILHAILLGAISTLAATELWTRQAIPAWVETVPADTVRAKAPERPIDWLLVDNQIRFDSTTQDFYHVVARANGHEGIGDLAEMNLIVSPEYQQLQLHHITIVRAGQKIDALASAEISELQRESDLESGMFTGRKTIHIVLKDLRPGDLVDYAYSTVGENPVYQKIKHGSYALGWSIPIGRRVLRVLAPAKQKLAYRLFQSPEEPRRSSLQENAPQGKQEFQVLLWDTRNPSPMLGEDNVPGRIIAYPSVQISALNDWKQVEDWASGLYKGEHPLPPELLDSAKLWKTRLPHEERLTRALRLVQKEIRYYGVEIGQNSHLPRTPVVVWNQRYGDCKDKALLLTRLLQALDIAAWPALVNTGLDGGTADLLPSPGIFDHVIVTAKLPQKTYWIDPTRTSQSGSLNDGADIDFGKALVVGNKEQGLENIPQSIRDKPNVIQNLIFRIPEFNAPVQLDIQSEYRYGRAEVMRTALQNREKIANDYLNYYSKVYGGARSLGAPSVQDPRDSNVVRVGESYSLDRFFRDENNQLNYFFLMDEVRNSFQIPSIVERKFPFALPFPYWVQSRLAVSYPPGAPMPDFDEDTFERKTPAYTFSFRQKPSKDSLIYEAEYRSLKAELQPKEVQQWIQDVNDFQKVLSLEFYYKSARADEAKVDNLLRSILKLGESTPAAEVRK